MLTTSSSMHRCSCSTRALELLVKDCTGAGWRQQRAQRFFENYRTFSTRQALREKEGERVLKSVTASSRRDGGVQRRRYGASLDDEKASDNVGAAWSEETDVAGTQEKIVEDETASEKTLDTVAPRETRIEHVNTVSSTEQPPVPDFPVATGQPEQSLDTTNSSRASKVHGRMMRKLRRIEDNRYKPSSKVEERVEESAEVGDEQEKQLEHVLKKIDQLEGPSFLKAAAKQKEKLALKWEEKMKERRIAKDAKTHEDIKNAQAEVEAKERQRRKTMEPWQSYKATLDKKFGDVGWQPRKRLSPDSLEGIRALHTSDPGTYTTPLLAQHFQISPESIRRILKSKWQPSESERVKRSERWEKRGLKKWEEMAELGQKPPKRWRAMGVKNPILEKKKKWEAQGGIERMGVVEEKRKDRWRDRVRGVDVQASESGMSLAERIL